MLKLLKDLLRPVKNSFPKSYDKSSYSQEGKDMLLNRFFENRTQGFYVDVGAHHPWRFSNTYFFYTRNWTGINIDPMPGFMDRFNKHRTKDVNLEIGISETEGELDYYIFSEPALNGVSLDTAKEFQKNDDNKLVRSVKLKTYPLKGILDKHLKSGQKIDFLTIDVEGLDLEVIKSNDWEKYRHTIVLAESHSSDLEQMGECPIYQYLKSKNYSLLAKTAKTFFYIDNNASF